MDEQIFEAEINPGEVASPHGADYTQGDVAHPMAHDMNDTDFDAYISSIKNGSLSGGNMQNSPKMPDGAALSDGRVPAGEPTGQLSAGNEPAIEPAPVASADENTPGLNGHDDAQKPHSAAEENPPFRTFGTREEFQDFMDRTVGERLRASKEAEKRYAALDARAKSIYADDENALEKLIENAERQKAEENGETPEAFRQRRQLEHDAALWRASQEERLRTENAVREKQLEWEREETQLKQVIPDFNFMRAMENKDFAHAVINEGMSPAAAYIKLSASEKQPEVPARRHVTEVASVAANGSAGAAVDPVNMNDADFSAYIHSIKAKG